MLENNITELEKELLAQITEHLEKGIVPFWSERAIDRQYGGYFVSVSPEGEVDENEDKYLVTQTRMIWSFSNLFRSYPERYEFREFASKGVNFLIRHFWDEKNGGFVWRTDRRGNVCDAGKVVYGQSFAIYALSEYTLATQDHTGLEYAEKVFDLLQKYCTDTRRGGYFENMEEDWRVSDAGVSAGDRKSLDIHMHLLEAFTTLAECSGKEIHRRKLREVIDVILDHMVDYKNGCGCNQFNVNFQPIPAISIRRTWNAERVAGEVMEQELDSTSYGHNMELIWLLSRAAEILHIDRNEFDVLTRMMSDHCLKYGFDKELGGVYRDGLHRGEPLVRDKEWWQNCEAMVGFLDCYECFGELKYFDAFRQIWEFSSRYFINWEKGEWVQLLSREGTVISGLFGNAWKGFYHTGRAVSECRKRLNKLISAEAVPE